MNIWIRRSLKVGLVAGGFVAIGTGVASAQGTPSSGTPADQNIVVGQQGLLPGSVTGALGNVPGDPIGQVLNNATKVTTSVVHVVTPPAKVQPLSRSPKAAPRHATPVTAHVSKAAAQYSNPTSWAGSKAKVRRARTVAQPVALPGAGAAPGDLGLPTGGLNSVPALGSLPVVSGGLPSLPVPGLSSLPVLGGGSASSALAGLPTLPLPLGVPGVQGGLPAGLPALPDVSSLKGALSAVPGVNGGSVAGGLPGVPVALPGLPDVSSLTNVTDALSGGLPALPGLPGLSGGLPGLPLPGLSGLPGLPGIGGASPISGSLPGGYGLHIPPGVAGLPAGLELGYGQRSGQVAAGPGVTSLLGLLGFYAVVPTGGNHEIEILDTGIKPRARTTDVNASSAGVFGDWSTPFHFTALSIDSGRNSQNGTLNQQSTDTSSDSFRFLGAVDAPINANVLTIDSGNNVQNGNVTQMVGRGTGLVGVVNLPITANGATFDAGNDAQNGDVDQMSDSTAAGSSMRLLDDVNLPLNGHLKSIHTGNNTQNGAVTQVLSDTSTGSIDQVVGNLNMPANGSDVVLSQGNSAQNGDVTQIDTVSQSGAQFLGADNVNMPLDGAGYAGYVANAAQNGNVTQANSTSATNGNGSSVQLVRNIRIPVDGAGVAGDIGNGSQNGATNQVDTATSPGSYVALADNAIIPGDGAGVAGVVGNGSQNGDATQVNSGAPGATTTDGAVSGFGSGIQVFRNLNIPISGAGVAGDIANGAQNGDPSQLDQSDNSGSLISGADNINIPGDGAGVAGVVGNGAQNGNPSQVYTGDPGYLDGAGELGGFGSGLRIFRNLNIPLTGGGVAGGIGNGGQNGDPSQVDIQRNGGMSFGLADNTNVPTNGAGVALVTGNGSQNANPTQVDVNPGLGGLDANLLGDNLNWPIDGSGVAAGTGNGAQNGAPSLFYLGSGSGLGFAGNGDTPVDANALIIGTGNGAQNESPALLWTPALNPSPFSFGPLHLVQNWNLPLIADGITLIKGLPSLPPTSLPVLTPAGVVVPGVGGVDANGFVPAPGFSVQNVTANPAAGLESGVSTLPQQFLGVATGLAGMLPVGGSAAAGGLGLPGLSGGLPGLSGLPGGLPGLSTLTQLPGLSGGVSGLTAITQVIPAGHVLGAI